MRTPETCEKIRAATRETWNKLHGKVNNARSKFGLDVRLEDVSLRKGHPALRLLHEMYNVRTNSEVGWVNYDPWEWHRPLRSELRSAFLMTNQPESELQRLFGMTYGDLDEEVLHY